MKGVNKVDLFKRLFAPKDVCSICGKTEYKKSGNIINLCKMGLGSSCVVVYSTRMAHPSCIKDVICNPERYNGDVREIVLRHVESRKYIQEKEAKELERIKELQKEICK